MDPSNHDISAFCTLRNNKYKKPEPNETQSALSKQRKLSDTNVPYEKLEISNQSLDSTSYTTIPSSIVESSADLIDLTDNLIQSKDRLVSHKYNDNLPSKSPRRITSLGGTLPKTSKEDTTSESGFQRLGSYCTLRPDQKRKLLVKTISTLRKSTNLSTEANHALTLIQELDTLYKTSTCTSSSTTSIDAQIDPDRIEECLYELDAYLEEIDRNCMRDETKDEYSLEDANNLSNRSSEDLDSCVREISSLSNQNSVVDIDDDKLTADMVNNIMTRRHPFRNTISVPSESKTLPANSSKDSLMASQRHMLWRRNSMRKTRPITLPEQTTSTAAISPQSNNFTTQQLPQSDTSETNSECDNESISDTLICTTDTHPLVSGMERTDHSEIPVNSSATTVATIAQCSSNSAVSHANEYDCEITERSAINPSERSLGDEFLNALTTTTNNNEAISSSDDNQPNGFSSNGTNTQHRPRQIGRRGEARSRVLSITTEMDALGDQRIIINHDRPSSSPITNHSRSRNSQNTNTISEPSSMATSRNTSPISIESSSASSSSVASTANNERPRQRPTCDPEASLDDQDNIEKSKMWPCAFSRILAGSCCTLGLFNISRFSIFSIHFGANFIVQFLILSVIYGIPMMLLLMCLGAKIKTGPMNMWRISPISKGIGIALVVIQALVALYSAVSIAWILVYFRDSFLSQSLRYRWQEPYEYFRGPIRENGSVKLSETVADYFNGVVLQRHQLGPIGSGRSTAATTGIGAIRFQLAFNLAVLWITVFIILCKGLRSYGKAVLGLMIVPLVGLAALCTKMLTMISVDNLQNLFPSTDWQDFFLNTQSWTSAAQEVFLTWALVGASIISIFSKTSSLHENSTVLRRDACIITLITLLGLILGAVLSNACVQILSDRGYYYFPGSFENVNSYLFLLPSNAPMPPKFASILSKRLPRYSTVLGEGYSKTVANANGESGFQAIRLVTELFPATLAAATQEQIGAVWSILGFFSFFLFALGQLCAMWKPIASSLGNSTSAVLLSCVTGLLLATPLATECGINIIHFLDVILGGSWCVLLLWVGHIFAIFLVRGRPYTSDLLVDDLHLSQTLSAFVALSWNVLLPVGLMTLCVIEYKQSNARDLYHWRGSTYWPMWARKVGGFLQVNMLMLIPITSLVQIYRYLSKGPPDILDRIQLLYRPSMSASGHARYPQSRSERPSPQRSAPATISLEPQANIDDAPPKYTPPPSYTTATGARLARMLRNSIRRSVRRIMGDTINNRRPRLQDITSTTSHPTDSSLPPAYSTVLVDPMGIETQNDIAPRVLYNSYTNRSRTLEHHQRVSTPTSPSSIALTRTGTITGGINVATTGRNSRAQTLTARDVAQLLRPSRSHFQRASSLGASVDQPIRNSLQKSLSRSVEQLVLSAVPPGHSSIVQLNLTDDEANSKTSVI